MGIKKLKSITFPGLPDTYTVEAGLSDDARAALLACFRNVAWINGDGQDYYKTLESALYGDVVGVWEWIWTPTGGNLLIENGNPAIGDVSVNKIVINKNSSMLANRRAFVVDSGVSPYYGLQTQEPLSIYPIPVPPNANRVSISISPQERYVALDILGFNQNAQEYFYIKSCGASDGSIKTGFLGGNNRYLLLYTKYDASGSQYVANPTSLFIKFEKVKEVWEWEWTPTSGNLKKRNGAPVTGDRYNNCNINANDTMKSARRLFYTDDGISDYTIFADGEKTGQYPIPIPRNANKINISITPAERWVIGTIVEYNPANKTYTNLRTLTPFAGSNSIMDSSIATPGDNRYLLIGTKYSETGTPVYENEPTSFRVTFEEVSQ